MTAMASGSSGADRAVLFATILGASMVFIDSSALNVALPALQRDLRATGTEVLWIPNAYTLLLASGILVGGSLGLALVRPGARRGILDRGPSGAGHGVDRRTTDNFCHELGAFHTCRDRFGHQQRGFAHCWSSDFGQALVARSAALPLTAEARAALQAQGTELGAAEPPANLPADLRAQVQQAIRQAFVDVFRVVLWIATGLAWLSALLAALFVDQQPIYKEFTAPV